MKKLIIHIYGIVQGVFFRYSTCKVARKLGLTGFVKNMPDGSVYIEAEGTSDKLKELLNFTKIGPETAEVEKIEHEYREAQHNFKGFEYSF